MNGSLQQLLDESGPDIKACCTRLYEHEWASWLLGESFHPGGLALTGRLGQLLELEPATQVLDVACGRGTSALHLAERSGCTLLGIDLSARNLGLARTEAALTGIGDRVRFVQADAEALPFEDDCFDAVFCECALCTFPDKGTAAREIYRVLKPGGRFGMSDVIRDGPSSDQLEHVLAIAACIGDAKSEQDYAGLLADAGFTIDRVERHDASLRTVAGQIHTRLIGAQLMIKTGQVASLDFDMTKARLLLNDAREAIAAGTLGYGLFIASKPSSTT